MRPYDSRRRVPIRLHIDHLDNEDRDVWAVRTPTRYITARSDQVTIGAIPFRLVGPRRVQPRAYLFGYARVRLRKDGRLLLEA